MKLFRDIIKSIGYNEGMVYSMPNPKELERIGNLFNVATDLNKTFLDKCSKTKFLSLKDYYKAEDEYIKLAGNTLGVKELGIVGKDDCYGCISDVKSELESGQLNQSLIKALESLRATYLENILKPAVQQYILNDASDKQVIKKLYTNALKIENLLEVIHFMSKVRDIE